MKLPPQIPQKLGEEWADIGENLSLAIEHVATHTYQIGFKDGAKRVLSLLTKGADYGDVKMEVENLLAQKGI